MSENYLEESRYVPSVYWFKYDYSRKDYALRMLADLNGCNVYEWPTTWVKETFDTLPESFSWPSLKANFIDFKLHNKTFVFMNSVPAFYGHEIALPLDGFEMFLDLLGVKVTSNAINIVYLVFKIMQLFHCDTTFVPLRIGEATIKKLDHIWECVCFEKEYTFYPTPPPKYRKVNCRPMNFSDFQNIHYNYFT